MNESVEAWLRVAEKDIRMLEKLLEDEELTDGVMFHAQQAVEKCLKALLEQLEVPIPRLHDLRRLHAVVSDAGVLLEVKEVFTELGMMPGAVFPRVFKARRW